MHYPRCSSNDLCVECDLGMELQEDIALVYASHAHLHEIVEQVRKVSNVGSSKEPVRIKPANFLVAYYNGNEVEVEGTIECDSALEALQIQDETSKHGIKTHIFISQSDLDINLVPKA